MTRAAALILALLLAACSGPQPRAHLPASGITASGGGADAFMHVEPKGMTNFPYQ